MTKRIFCLVTTLVMVISLVGVLPAITVFGDTSNPTTEPTTMSSTIATTTTSTKNKTTTKTTTKNKAKAKAKKAMKKAKIKKLKVVSRDNKIVANWKIVKKAKGYQIQLSSYSNFKRIIKTINIGANSELIDNKIGLMINKKLPTGSSYYIRVRPYTKYKTKNGTTKKAYGKWKKSKKIKIDKNFISYWNSSNGITSYVDEYKNQVWSTDGLITTYDKILAEYGITRSYTIVKKG